MMMMMIYLYNEIGYREREEVFTGRRCNKCWCSNGEIRFAFVFIAVFVLYLYLCLGVRRSSARRQAQVTDDKNNHDDDHHDHDCNDDDHDEIKMMLPG